MKYQTKTIDETKDVAAELVKSLRGGEVVSLKGDLGAGKTTFAQGMAKALGVSELVKSPTYALVKSYVTSHDKIKHFIHVDLYRLENGVDVEEIGLDEWLGRSDVVVVIEWIERSDLKSDVVVILNIGEREEREIKVK